MYKLIKTGLWSCILGVIFAIAFNSPPLLAATNTAGHGTSSGQTYKSCMKSCQESYDYCKKHQSKTMNCSTRWLACVEWCETAIDKKGKQPRKTRFLKPQRKQQAPAKRSRGNTRKKPLHNGTIRK